jgi:hypothetical protein
MGQSDDSQEAIASVVEVERVPKVWDTRMALVNEQRGRESWYWVVADTGSEEGY